MNLKKIVIQALLVFSVLFLVACSDDDNNQLNNEELTGQFIDDLVEGLVYHCSSGEFYETTANGEFTCPASDDVTFYLKTNQLGPVPATTSVVTPYTLFPNNLQAAINLARLLQSIDADGDPNNGVIVANDSLVSLLPDNIDFSSPTFAADMQAAGITIQVTAEQAQQNLNDAIAQYVQDTQPGTYAPVANAGTDQNVSTGATVNLSAAGSTDADGDTLIYFWGIQSAPVGSSASLTLPSSVNASFVADVDGEYVIKLMVFDGISVDSDTVSITASPGVALPGIPLGLQATAGDTEVSLTWTTVSNATSYTVYWNTTGSVSTSDASFTAGSNTQVTHTGRTNGTTYYYRISASNTSGEGELSTEVSATPEDPGPGVPVAPQGLQGTAGDTEVTLSWGSVSGATSYTVYWNITGTVSISDASIAADSSTQITHTGLTNETTYYYRVSASNASGEGALSAEVSVTPAAPATEIPAVPTGLQAVAGDAQVALSWDTATGATSYTLYWATAGNVESGSFDTGSNTQYTHTALTNGTTYYYRVSASNTAGESAQTSTISTTPAIPVPANLQATASDGQVELSWTAVAGGTYNYTVYWNTSGNVTTADTSIDAGTGTQVVHTGLSSGTSYYYRVSATGAAGEGELSATVESTQQSAWQWANPKPHGNSVEDIVYGSNLYVSISGGGGIYTSSDTINWTKRYSGTAKSLWGAVWNGSQFVVVGETGTILTSPDGIVWTVRSSGTSTNLSDVSWNGERFVAVGNYGTILTSPDGTSWTSQTSNFPTPTGGLAKVIWANNQFVTVGVGLSGGLVGVILTSPDGISWSSRTTNVTSNINGIAWDGSKYLAMASGEKVLTSSDGITWTLHTIDPYINLTGGDILWDGSQFIQLLQLQLVGTSPDGLSWTTHPTNASDDLRTLIWDGSQYVAGGFSGLIMTSTDAVSWTQQLPVTAITSEGIEDILWNSSQSQFVAVGRAGNILTSPDGDNWTLQTSGTETYWFNSLVWSDTQSQYVAVGSSDTIHTSPDGVNWTSRNSGTSNKTFKSVTWDGSQYVAVGFYGIIVTSPDGISWTTRNTDTQHNFQGVTSNGSMLVAAGYGSNSNTGILWSSSDGVNWTEDTSYFRQLRDVVWGNNLFLATGAIGWTYSSPDGVTWTSHYTGTSGYMSHVEWDGSQFVSSYVSIIYTSPDGINWATQNTPSSNLLNGIAWNDSGKAVAVGWSGNILTNTNW